MRFDSLVLADDSVFGDTKKFLIGFCTNSTGDHGSKWGPWAGHVCVIVLVSSAMHRCAEVQL